MELSQRWLDLHSMKHPHLEKEIHVSVFSELREGKQEERKEPKKERLTGKIVGADMSWEKGRQSDKSKDHIPGKPTPLPGPAWMVFGNLVFFVGAPVTTGAKI